MTTNLPDVTTVLVDNGEQEEEEDVSKTTPVTTTITRKVTSADTKIIYHMCQERLWQKAVESGKAYFPPTFEEDGFFIHATAVPIQLIEIANQFIPIRKEHGFV